MNAVSSVKKGREGKGRQDRQRIDDRRDQNKYITPKTILEAEEGDTTTGTKENG